MGGRTAHGRGVPGFGGARTALVLVVLLSLAAAANAEDPGPIYYSEEAVEVGMAYSWFTEGLGQGDYEYARYYLDREVYDYWSVEVGRASRFGDTGVGIGTMYTRYLRRGPIIGGGFSTGTGEFVYPEYRIDLRLGWSFLERQNLRFYLRYIRSQSKAENYFDGFGAELEYYVDDHWVIEAVERYDVGYPGRNISTSTGLWIGYVIWKKALFQIGGKTGDVSYQLVGPDEALVDYNSNSVDAFVQVYVRNRAGFETKVEYESNDIYNVFTLMIAVFKEW